MGRDEVKPGEKWAFDGEVADAFDDMLSRSIPQYDVMRETVSRIGASFLRPGGWAVDLGCSRGEALAGVRDAARVAGAHFVGYEVSEPMLAAARERFADAPDVEIIRSDLRLPLPLPGVLGQMPCADVVLAVLTVQFVPIEHRLRLLADARAALRDGGAMILVEKVLGASARLDALMVDHYYEMKRENGYSDEQIDRKRLALEGVLVPVTAAWNADLLRSAGFAEVDCFWRWANFAGWVAVA